MNVINKLLIAFFMIGLMLATTACSASKTNNVNTGTDNNNVNIGAENSNVNVAPSTGSIQRISDVKKPELFGKNVTVRGMVVNNLKIGSLSGYRLNDSTGSIPISSQNLAKINSTVTVTGTLHNSSVFGYYILANE